MDFKKITADPGLVLEHTQCSGPPTSGYITSNDHGKSYSDYIQKAYVLNGFEKGYGNLHFPRTEGQGNEAIISFFKAMPSVLTDAGVTQAGSSTCVCVCLCFVYNNTFYHIPNNTTYHIMPYHPYGHHITKPSTYIRIYFHNTILGRSVRPIRHHKKPFPAQKSCSTTRV